MMLAASLLLLPPLLAPPSSDPCPATIPAPAAAMATAQQQDGGVPFVMEAEEVARLHEASGLPLELFLAGLVKPTLGMARPPISGFRVGAVGLGESGRVFRGVNLEFPGLPLHHSVHAEQCLVAAAAQHGERRLRFLAVSAAPCGHCRQFLQELAGAADMRVVIVDPEVEVHSLPHLLPRRFGPHDLLAEGFPLLLEPHVNNLVLLPVPPPDDDHHHRGPAARTSSASSDHGLAGAASHGLTRNGYKSVPNGLVLRPRERYRSATNSKSAAKAAAAALKAATAGVAAAGGVALAELRAAALEAANSAYAPYSGCPSGMALATSKGRTYGGSYMESAAYNPSLSPLQSAIISFVTQDGGGYEDIVQAVLVETSGAKVQHAATVQLALQKIAPKCSFHVCHAHQGGGAVAASSTL